jgi:glyoxylate reductase
MKMKPKVYLTRRIPEVIFNKMAEECEISQWPEADRPVPRDVLEREIAKVDGLYCFVSDQIDRNLLEKAPHLKLISIMAVGYNNIDIEAAKERGIVVANTPGVLTDTTADLTFALMMATARRLVEAADYLKNGRWKSWAPMQLTGQDIFGATLGIIGLGRIGTALAKRAKGFDMDILYYNRSRKPDVEKEMGIKFAELDHLLKESDFVCVMTPYTPETHNLIGDREISLMKKTAILINTARGGIVNEDALYRSLKNGDILAAGLDVYEQEPIPSNHPLLQLPNVVALPHIGSASYQTRMKMADLAANNLFLALKGLPPKHVVI